MAPVTTATDDIIVAIDASISQFISGVTVHWDEQNNYARLVGSASCASAAAPLSLSDGTQFEPWDARQLVEQDGAIVLDVSREPDDQKIRVRFARIPKPLARTS